MKCVICKQEIQPGEMYVQHMNAFVHVGPCSQHLAENADKLNESSEALEETELLL